MPEIGAKRGEWLMKDRSIKKNVPGRFNGKAIDSFNPAYSSISFGFDPSGLRQRFILNEEGIVLVEQADGSYIPLIDPLDENEVAIAYRNKSNGKSIPLPKFDMLAASRGRLLAKVKNKNQYFHLKLSELFWTEDNKPVPSNFIKMDSAFYGKDISKPEVPSELKDDYKGHPSAARFSLFTMFLNHGYLATDFSVVPMKPLVWYEIDDRPPLPVLDFQDYLDIRTKHVQKVFEDDSKILNRIVGKSVNREYHKLAIDELLKPRLFTEPVEAINGIRDTLFSWIPDFPWPFEYLKTALEYLFSAVLVLILDIITAIVGIILIILWPLLVTIITSTIVSSIKDPLMKENDPSPLINAVITFGSVELKNLMSTEENGRPAAIRIDEVKNSDGEDGRSATVRIDEQRDPKESNIYFLPKAFYEKLYEKNEDDENPDVAIFIDRLIRNVRIDKDRIFPSDPPTDMPLNNSIPSRVSVMYSENTSFPGSDLKGNYRTTQRRTIDYQEVLDIGIGYSHWFERWTPKYGGEMHSLLAKRPIFQQEKFNSIMYRFLNGPIKDGDGYNDGTTNFYKFVKLSNIADDQKQKVAILWIDEQTYFSQRWRLVHPTKDVAGDLFSQSKVLSENPHYFEFEEKKYYDPMAWGHVDDTSRMVTARQTILLTCSKKSVSIGDTKIFSFNYNYGTSDYSWRWRKPPNAIVLYENNDIRNDAEQNRLKDIVYIDSIKLREDLIILLKGKKMVDDKLINGYWYQHVFPADTLPRPLKRYLKSDSQPMNGYDHPWYFMGEAGFHLAEKFPVFAAYESKIVPRTQYYTVELLNSPGRELDIHEIKEFIWYNGGWDLQDDSKKALYHNTVNFTWKLKEVSSPEVQNYDEIPLRQLVKNRRNNNNLSMFEDKTPFKLLDRGPLGLILVFADIRDDDLQVVSNLPQEICLDRPIKKSPLNPKEFDRIGQKDQLSQMNQEAPDEIKLILKEHQEFVMPPIVDLIKIKWKHNHSKLQIEIYSPLAEHRLLENIWIMTIGYIEDGVEYILVRLQVAGNFERNKKDHIGLIDSATIEQRIDPERAYCGTLIFSEEDILKAKEILHQKNITLRGLSIWLENAVGQIALPDRIEIDN
ncbi:hypothetical protein GCM10009117_13200 [Gangjinia marincola]|uniref:Uncharacterized protein n=1 Tax=Gangjinia marincola TaxID=578463 RepID=A0ABP3XRV5_9FLAO